MKHCTWWTHAILMSTPRTGGTALHFLTCRRGNLEVAKLLVESCNVAVNIPNRSGLTPLHQACATGRWQLRELEQSAESLWRQMPSMEVGMKEV
mmetsp:Transcript_11037/g.30490  ORF Transcript_11037/g.30490 Transcript_11037/m.30490 type:complete len:94 (-) Transcript_11037:1650-1931(-)